MLHDAYHKSTSRDSNYLDHTIELYYDTDVVLYSVQLPIHYDMVVAGYDTDVVLKVTLSLLARRVRKRT